MDTPIPLDHPGWLDPSQWPYAPRTVALAAGRLHAVEAGAGPTVVLVHGTPTWAFEWRHVIAGLRDTHRVVAWDHLGFGLSDQPQDAGYRPEDHAIRFAAAMDALCPEGPVSLVVHDFGGPIAMDWALSHPERLHRLVVVNSWMWSFADDPLMAGRARMVHSRLGRFLYRRANASLRLIMPSAYGDRKRLTPAIHRQYLSVFPDADSRERVLFALAQALTDSAPFFDGLWQRRERLAGVPLSLIWGMRDSAFGPDILARWQSAFPGAAVTRLPDAGHWPHEEAPEAVVAALRAVLA